MPTKVPISAPQFLITWYCRNCGHDSSCMDTDTPKCYHCSKPDLLELESQKLTQQVLSNRLYTVADRLMGNLEEAYKNSRTMLKDHPEEEVLILEALSASQEIVEAVQYEM